MNHIVVAIPRDARLLKAAQQFFKSKGTVHRSRYFSAAFFSNNQEKIFSTNPVLNREELSDLLANEDFLQIQGASVIAEIRNADCMLLTDVLGFAPLFKYQREHQIVYSTSLDFLAKHLPTTINWDAWADLFAFSVILQDQTQFKEISRVPKASIIRVSNTLTEETYHDYFTTNSKTVQAGQVIEALGKVMGTVAKQASITLPLSGGVDSRIFGALLVRYQIPQCFTTHKDTGKGSNEVHLAKQVCQALGGHWSSIELPPSYFQDHLQQSLVDTYFETTIHAWYYPFVKALPRDAWIIDGLGGTLFKGGLISPTVQAAANSGNWSQVEKGMENGFRYLLNSRPTRGEELSLLPTSLQEIMQQRQEKAFARECATYPKNKNLPLNMLLNLRFRRVIAPSVYGILGQRFNVVSPFLIPPVRDLLLQTPLDEKPALARQVLKHLKLHKLPGTFGKSKQLVTNGILNLASKGTPFAQQILLWGKSAHAKGTIRYSPDTLSWLKYLLPQKKTQKLTQKIKEKPVPYQIDVFLKAVMLELWQKRYGGIR